MKTSEIIEDISRRGLLKGIAGGAALAVTSAAAKDNRSFQPIVNTTNPEVVKQALATLEQEKQKLLLLKQQLDNKNPRFSNLSPQRLESYSRDIESRLRTNAAFINRGKSQLASLMSNVTPINKDFNTANTAPSNSIKPEFRQSKVINTPNDF